MDLTEPCQGPGILLIFSPCFLLYKKQFSPDFVSQNLALTLCLFITYICSYSLNLVISELYVADSFFFLIVKERLIFIISLTFLLAIYIYIKLILLFFVCNMTVSPLSEHIWFPASCDCSSPHTLLQGGHQTGTWGRVR